MRRRTQVAFKDSVERKGGGVDLQPPEEHHRHLLLTWKRKVEDDDPPTPPPNAHHCPQHTSLLFFVGVKKSLEAFQGREDVPLDPSFRGDPSEEVKSLLVLHSPTQTAIFPNSPAW